MKKYYLLPSLLFFGIARGMNFSVEEQLAQATAMTLHHLHTQAVIYKKTKKLAQYQQTLHTISLGCIKNLTPKPDNIFNKPQFVALRARLQHYYLYARFKASSLKSDKEAFSSLRKTRRTIKKWQRNQHYQVKREYSKKINARLKTLSIKIRKSRKRK